MLRAALETFERHGFSVLLIALGIVARLFMDREPITIVRVIRLLVAGVFVGALVSLALVDTSFSEPTKGAIIGVCALLSEDLLTGLLALGKRAHDGAVLGSFLDKWRL